MLTYSVSSGIRLAAMLCMVASSSCLEAARDRLVGEWDLEEVTEVHEHLLCLKLPPGRLTCRSLAEGLRDIRLVLKNTEAADIKFSLQSEEVHFAHPVTLEFETLPLIGLLQQLSDAAGVALRVEPEQVVILARNTIGGLLRTRFFHAPGFEMPRREAPVHDPFVIDKRMVLPMAKVNTPPGFWIVFDSDYENMMVNGDAATLDLVKKMVEEAKVDSSNEPKKRVSRTMFVVSEICPDHEMDMTTVQKLKKWKLPYFEVKGISVEKAIEQLIAATRDLDQEKLGLDIVIKGPISASDPISWKFEDQLVAMTLRQLADLLKMSPVLHGKQILLLPKSEVPPFHGTVTYRVPKDFLASGETAEDVLKMQGVLFRQGSSVAYDEHNHLLTVKNTLGNIDIIEMYLEDLWRQSSEPLPPLNPSVKE